MRRPVFGAAVRHFHKHVNGSRTRMTQAAEVLDDNLSAGGKSSRQKLSREVVEQAAITVAHREGFSALSIRNVAKVLGVAPMALYTHVKNKDELSEHVADALIGSIDTRTQPGLAWQDRVRTLLRSHRDLVMKHRDAMPYIATASAHPGPGMQRFSDTIIAILASAGFEHDTAEELCFMLITYNYGSSITAGRHRDGANNLLHYNDGLGTIMRAYEQRLSRPALGRVLSMAERLRFGRR